MSAIHEVRAAEKKMQALLDALKNAEGQEKLRLSVELRDVTDQYAKAIRELKF
jgi:hypothetical protein